MIKQWLKNYYNRCAADRLVQDQHRELVAAIQDGDVNSISSQWAKIEGKDAFLERLCYLAKRGVYSTVYGDLLDEALKADDLPVFKAVFAFKPDPNVVIRNSYVSPFAYYDASEPLLAAAISRGARNIALFLALQPDLDLNARGKLDVVRMPWERADSPPSFLSLARGKPGMEDVAAVLAQREKSQTTPPAPRP